MSKRKRNDQNCPAITDWPDEFQRLNKFHNALNITYAFFCTRKQLATTLDNLNSLLKTSLNFLPSTTDFAKVAFLLGPSVCFRYLSEGQLAADLPKSQGNRNVDDFRLPTSDSNSSDSNKQVLHFEYLHGDLKRQVADPVTGEPTAPRSRLRHAELQLPVYSHKQLVKLVEKRKTKFTDAIQDFLRECEAQNYDPATRLEQACKQFLPNEPEFFNDEKLVQSSLPSTIPTNRKSIREIINEIKESNLYISQIVPDGHRCFPAQEASYGRLEFALSQGLIDALATRGIGQIYSHQAEAINNLYNGFDAIIATSTSSGKSLIYQIPVLHELEKNPDAKAMYIFPTKALAQDQKKNLMEVLQYLPGLKRVVVDTFDGDTAFSEREFIRTSASIIFTNPDMLHIAILPQEDAWRTFLKNLKFVVVDELHVYNGLFGSHVALVMRRLRRICAALGNKNIRFISCSATVSNPEEHMKSMFGLTKVKLTQTDGSPCGQKEFICWNPPYKDSEDPRSGRRSSLNESAKLFCQLILRGVRVIAFARIRQTCEALISEVRRELVDLNRNEVAQRVMSYRGGYIAEDRRQIEQTMFDGQLLGIVATSALELGVDIGSLDAVITVGFPYTISNLRQQSGRAGRRNKDSLSVLVGDAFPTDQYFMSNPNELFTRPNCSLQIDLENILCLEAHIQCAAFELPLKPKIDEAYFGPLVHKLTKERMRKDRNGFFHCSERYLPCPSRKVAIRDAEEDRFAIIDITNGRNMVLEDLEASRAFFTVYEGGIFMHQGRKYLVKEFNQDKMMAKVERSEVTWTTQQRDYTDIDPVETQAIRKLTGSHSKAYLGPIRIKQVVYGFFKLDARRRILDAVHVDNEPIVLYSKGFWLDVPRGALEILVSRRLNTAAGIHAAEHAILSLMPNFVISMAGDVRTECKLSIKEFSKKESQRKRPARLTFYDTKGGSSGSGISARGFEHVDLLLRQAMERVSGCLCMEGCLECCCSEVCKDANQVISKAGAEVILKSLLNLDIDLEKLPMGPDDSSAAVFETVVPATEVRITGTCGIEDEDL